MKNLKWILIASALYSQISTAGTCKNFEEVSNVISKAYQTSKANEDGILNSLIPHEELKKLQSLNVLVHSGELVFIPKKEPTPLDKIERLSTQMLQPGLDPIHERFFLNATLIVVPAVAVLESGEIVVMELSLENKIDRNPRCVISGWTRRLTMAVK